MEFGATVAADGDQGRTLTKWVGMLAPQADQDPVDNDSPHPDHIDDGLSRFESVKQFAIGPGQRLSNSSNVVAGFSEEAIQSSDRGIPILPHVAN